MPDASPPVVITPPSVGRHALVGAPVGVGAGVVVGTIDAWAAIEALAVQGGGGFLAAVMMSPIYFFYGGRNGALLGAPAFALGGAMLAGLASIYRDVPQQVWARAGLVISVLAFVAALTWVLEHPAALFRMWS